MQVLTQALYDVLAADYTINRLAPGGIHEGIAPENTPTPYIIITKASGGREWTFTRVLSRDYEYDIKNVTDDEAGSAATFDERMSVGDMIAERVLDLLNDATLTVTGYNSLVCRHDVEIDYIEEQPGHVYRHRGGTFHIEVSPA